MERHIYSVSEVNQLIKSMLDREPQLGEIFLRGEISNYKLYPSGHHYFTLKDAEGAIAVSCSRGRPSACAFGRRTA